MENALNCVIANNTIHDFNTGIGILNSGNSKIVNNSILKAEYGISIEGHYVEPEKQSVISNNTIAGNSIEGCKNALIIVKSNENEISGNWISGNGIGINLEDSWWNRIYNNYLSNNLNAFAKNQEKNYWSVDKTAGKNIVGGIYVAGNYWSDYSNYEDRDGDGIGDTPYVIDDHNEDPLPLLKLPIMNNRTKEFYPSVSLAVANASTGDEIIVKLKGKYYDNVEIQTPITIKPDSNLSLGDVVIVPSNASKAVFTIKSNGVKIEGFVITNAPIGVSIENAQNCTIAKNELKGNVVGIGLRNSQRNTISSNYILNNEFGISMQNSGQNTIYNNYISNINNTLLDNSVNNIWNIQPVAGRNIINGTNLGGNFWSDYIGRDSNKDGFGDTPYTISGSYTKDSYPLAKNLSRIYIVGNQNFTAENGVLYGSGTAEEPYLIEGYSLFLDNNTPVIQIENTTAHFLLRNCEVYSNAPAVLLKNVRNGVLEGIFSNPSMTYGLPSTGIMLVDSINNEIRSCDLTVSRYSEAGIYLLNSSNNNLIANQIKTLVSRNMFDNTVYSGIKLNKSSNNSIERNDIENLLYGIHLIASSSNLIIENDASLNRKYGIFLDSSTGNRLVENNASRNSVQSDSTGIYLHSSSQNTIEMNLAGFNSLAGIKLVSSSNNVLRNNSAFNNSVGIIFESSNQNQLINNTAKSNADSGVFLLLSSNNTIRGNEFSCPEVAYPSAPSQNYGIKIQESDNNLFRDNIIINNAYGVYILFTLSQASSGNFSSNTFYNNFIKSQERYSMEFNTTSYQLEYRYYTINVGFAPTQQTYYDYSYYGEQAIRANKWNTTKTAGKNIVGGDYLGGNYWSDYKGADLNGDRLGDTLTPHYGDYMPLMLATTGIHITKNSEFTEENGVISGSGTANDPYVIANLEVNTISTHGIWIENTNAYFVVRNVTVYGGKQTLTTGILLQNVTNGRIEAINSIENNIGISVERSNNIRLDNCSFNSNNVAIAIEKSNNVSMHNFNLSNNNYGIQLGNSTNTTIHNSKFLNSSLYAINMTSSRLNSTQISLGTGVEIRNCVGFNITNSIIENVTQIGILWLNSSGVIYNNTIRWNREANIRIQNSSNVGILLNNLSYSKTGIEVKFSNNLTISGNKISNHYNLAEIGGGYGVKVESSENVTLIFNSILANSVFGISALNSNLSILNNKIVGVQNSMPPRWSVFASNVGIYSENSSGLVKNNYISGHTYAIYLNCPNTVRELSIVENTIAFSEEGIRDIACRNEFLERNRFFGNNYALKFNSPNLKKIRDNSFYTNNEMDVVVEIGGNAGNILLNRTYSEKGLNLTEGIISLNEVSWDSAERGGNALKSAIVGLNSTAFGFSKEVGGVLSVHVNASANANLSLFSGLYRERIYAVDTITGEIHELYAKNFTAQYGYLYPKSVDKDIVVNIYGLNNSIYDLFYEVIDTDGDKALGYARILVKNAKIVITNISSTTAERIYSLHRVPNPGQIFSSREDYNTTNERGSFVYVTVKNQGVKGGFGIIKIHVPDYVNGVVGEINKVIYLEPNETGNYTFYVLLTKYDPINGWKPSDPSVFPSNKKLPINVTVEDLPSYITADSKMHDISFKLGPVIRILDYDNYSYPRDPNNPSALYDGDGDGIIEAGEGYHFSLEFDNIGDEPANIQLFQHTETIICNSCKYIPPEVCRHYPNVITRTEEFHPEMSFFNPEDYYKPQFWDTPNRLFGLLYPNGTSGISYQYYREKLINDAHIDWWFDRPDLGYYPPIDYSGKEKITVEVYYSIPGQSLPHRYYTVSVNSYNLSVKALEKTFIPLSFHMADGDINAFVHSVSINNGIVNLRLKNDNDYVYYEYKFDGSYDPSPKGFKWYKVIPPEYTVEASAEKAKQPNTTIPHMKANVGIKWSLWANELKLGMMTLEAIVSILLDEATGGAIDIEFADAVMSFTNILLSLVNTYESGESTIPLTIEINKVQISTQELAEDGLDAEYFRRIANGDIDSSTATTFIKAVWNNDDLQKAFGREILKMVAKSLGLEKVYIVLVDPNSPEDAFDDFKDALLDYLKDSKRLTEDQAERIGKVVDAVMVFKDLGEWAYYNLEATRLDERSLNILDPPEDFVVEVSGEKRTYFGGLYKTQIDGEGNVSIRFLENGLVEIVGNYSTKPEKIPFNSEGIEELVVSLRGERDGEKMPGIAKVEIIPKAGYALEAFLAFRNPQLQRAFIAGYFEKLSNLTAITEGDRIVLIGEGTLAVSSDDVLIEGTIRLNKTIVEAQQRIVGYYTFEKEGKQKLSVNFNPTIGVPMNKTNLEVLVEDGAGFESDLPFKKEGNVYKLSYLPESLEANYLSAEKVQEGYKTYAIIALLAIVAFLALFIALRRR
ncbi:MAG: NosD domain-containing protein [Archaeoglobaceae archaeon]